MGHRLVLAQGRRSAAVAGEVKDHPSIAEEIFQARRDGATNALFVIVAYLKAKGLHALGDELIEVFSDPA